jgi:hypothetical protein
VRRFVEWLLDQFPELRIVVASFDYGPRAAGAR